jgi:mRNA interferase MazF
MKDFATWMPKKAQLDALSHKPPLVSERDIWWASVGENIGSEMNGKSDLFSRPVIIFCKLAHGFYFVVPTSTKPKEGSWYVPFTRGGKSVVACLHQTKAIDYRRLSSKLGQIDTADYELVQKGFVKLYIKNIPRSLEQGCG